MTFPIDLRSYKPLEFSTAQAGLNDEQRETLKNNIGLVRDSLVFFTALANVKGLGGHTGGAYDIVPEILIMDGFMKGDERFFPVYFDEAGWIPWSKRQPQVSKSLFELCLQNISAFFRGPNCQTAVGP